MHSAAEPLGATHGEPPLPLLAGEAPDAWSAWSDELNGDRLADLTAEGLLSHDRSRVASLALAPSSSACIPKTRIGLFGFSEPTRTEVFPYASSCAHRASLDFGPGLASGTRFFLSQDTYRGRAGSPPSLHKYAYASENPVRYTDPSGHSLLDHRNAMRYIVWKYPIFQKVHAVVTFTSMPTDGLTIPITAPLWGLTYPEANLLPMMGRIYLTDRYLEEGRSSDVSFQGSLMENLVHELLHVVLTYYLGWWRVLREGEKLHNLIHGLSFSMMVDYEAWLRTTNFGWNTLPDIPFDVLFIGDDDIEGY